MPLSSQDTKFVQQDGFVTRLATIPHQMTHSPFREASESIDGVSGHCFFAWEGCETYSNCGQITKTCVWLQFSGVSTHERWKPQKTITVDGDFGRRLQKASSLSGYQTCNGKLWALCENVGRAARTQSTQLRARHCREAIGKRTLCNNKFDGEFDGEIKKLTRKPI